MAATLADLDSTTWVFAAALATLRDIGSGSMHAALEADPERAAVLRQAGLVSTADGRAAVLGLGEQSSASSAGSSAAARLSSFEQALSAAAGEAPVGWAGQPDRVLLEQGRASAATGHAIATRLAPQLPGLAPRLAAPGACVLDVGAGVGALALALAAALPAARVIGIDPLERAVRLADHEMAGAGPERHRVDLRVQRAEELSDVDRYDLAWLPAPFLTQRAVSAALARIVVALKPGGWIVVGTNPPPADDLARAVARWIAARNGGSAFDATQMSAQLSELGLHDVASHPTVPGGPSLVVGRRSQ